MNSNSTMAAVSMKSGKKHSSLLLAGVSTLVSMGFAMPALAAPVAGFDQHSALAITASSADQAQLVTLPSALNIGDAQTMSADAAKSLEPQLSQIAVTQLTLAPVPILSIGLVGSQQTVRRGEASQFVGFSNYPAFVKRAELRVFTPDTDIAGVPHAIVEADRNGVIKWTPTNYAGDAMRYVYRVYDETGQFDETAPQNLTVLSVANLLPTEEISRPDFGMIDSAALRNIALDDAEVLTVAGQAVSVDDMVRISGQIAPTDSQGRFAATQLVQANCAGIAVSVTDGCGRIGNTVAAPSPIQMPVLQQVAPQRSIVPAIAGAAQPNDGMTITIDPEDKPLADNPYAIKMRTDATHVDPVLAVGLADSERTVVRGGNARFISYTNYPSFIDRREIRIFRVDASPDAQPVAVVAANKDGVAQWTPGSEVEGDLFYVYRVYDREGRFDQTRPQELTVLNGPFSTPTPPVRPLFGTRDEAAVRNISLNKAATVTVTGLADPAAEVVRVAGQVVPLEADGRFVSQQIVAQDARQVWITVGHGEEARFTAMRDVERKRDNWFIVGQGDLTFVSSNGKGPAVEVSGDKTADGDYLTSRAAFYAKGTLANGVKITSSLDTGETLLSDLFSNIDRKDPRQLLRRMDSNQYYTTYGDDSTLVEDAPTQSRFYLKVQKEKSSLLVGNFTVDIQQAELAQLNRGVFGAIVDHKSLATTSFGESKVQFTAFASDPGTIPGRDEFRGTGGSLYYLKRRDLTVGSERLSVEVRDRDTGIVLSRRELRAQEDYDIDYFQGRLTLLRPLSSHVADSDLVRDGSRGGDVPVLVAHYEYSPAVGDVSGYTLGGRAAGWLGDSVRLGVTAQRETTDAADQTLLGADATVRIHAGTYVKAEVAQSEGPGFGQANSVDGGLSFVNRLAVGTAGDKAQSYRAEVAVDFAELRGKTGDLGKASAFVEHLGAGFSANSQITPNRTDRWGVALEAPVGDTTRVSGKLERLDTASVGRRTVGSAQVAQKLGNDVTVSVGVKHNEQAVGLINNSTESGKRTDGAVQIAYEPIDEDWSVHAFGQVTLAHDAGRLANNRGGVGGKLEISDRSSVAAEVSHGDGGLGANVELSHRYGDGSETYLGYGLLTDRTDQGLEPASSFSRTNRGTLTMGARHRFSSALSIHGENKIGHGGAAPSVMRSFGMDWNPSKTWSFSGSFENGHVDDADTGVFRRTAATFGVGYTTDEVQFGTNVEGRFEKGTGRDQKVWLFRNTASVQVNPDWRALGRLNFAIADNDKADVRAADFVEGTVGFAYRPVLNDRLNLLTRYTYLKDMGPIGQITEGGQTASPKQKSQIFSIDANYDLTTTVTLGGKYAFRKGSVSLGRDSDTYVSSNTQLAVLRADWRVVKQWDAVVEGHYLGNDRAGDHRWGGLAALYRHIDANVKIGAGYSFSDFSSDLGDQSYTSKGFFVNLLGKF